MKTMKSLKAVAVLAAIVSSTAGAQVTGQKVAAPIGPLLSLSAPGSCAVDACSLIGFGTITGGSIYSASVSGAAMPAGTEGNFLAAGPTAGTPALLTFTEALSSIGFLWGSHDDYNTLEVLHSGGGSMSFTSLGLGFAPQTAGNQGLAQYVRFDAQTGYEITGLRFKSSTNAFEVSNFSVPAGGTSQVPEPASVALLASGLLGMVGVARRRRQRTA